MADHRRGSRQDPRRRIGYDLSIIPDIERLDEKLDEIESLDPAMFVRPPRAVRQAVQTSWSKRRHGRPR